MVKRIIAIASVLLVVCLLAACGSATERSDDVAPISEMPEAESKDNEQEKDSEIESVSEIVEDTTEEEAEEMMIKITAGNYIITATVYDNAAGRALWDRLPLTLPMMNLYGREMCYRFGTGGLPDEDAADSGYEIGDISYWPPAGSLVILYKQNGEIFEQQPIGHTNDDISFFEGMEDTDILFERADN